MSQENEYKFFQQVVSRITSSLDLAESMVSVFSLLKEHFPIDGISFHQYSSQLQALKLLFLVTEDRFDYVEKKLSLNQEGVLYMEGYEREKPLVILSDHEEDEIADAHRKAISHILPYKSSTYLIGYMGSGDVTIGHLCFIGKQLRCFTNEHVSKLKLLLGPFTLAMSNMLQFKRTIEFQHRLSKEKKDLEQELQQLKSSPIIGDRGGLFPLMKTIKQLEGRETPVLIFGETGTGKELIADKIQKESPRAGKPFIKINCGAIPESLIDSELFGYVKGAFTGAAQSHPGKFEQADGGTLFLDEIGELPIRAQVRLLRVLQNNVVERIGGKKSIPINVRIIAATHRHLESMIQDGSFREDLYYRLFVFPIHIPPLRDRTQDIPSLAHYFIERTCKNLKITSPPVLLPDSMSSLKSYPWPGNVRQLENMVERAVILSRNGFLELEKFLPEHKEDELIPDITKDYIKKLIDEHVHKAVIPSALNHPIKKKGKKIHPFKTNNILPLEETIRKNIELALSHCDGTVNGPNGAAAILGINPSTLRTKMRKLGIKAKFWKQENFSDTSD